MVGIVAFTSRVNEVHITSASCMHARRRQPTAPAAAPSAATAFTIAAACPAAAAPAPAFPVMVDGEDQSTAAFDHGVMPELHIWEPGTTSAPPRTQYRKQCNVAHPNFSAYVVIGMVAWTWRLQGRQTRIKLHKVKLQRHSTIRGQLIGRVRPVKAGNLNAAYIWVT